MHSALAKSRFFDPRDVAFLHEYNSQLTNIKHDPNICSGCNLNSLMGETIWHSLSQDPSIRTISEQHLARLKKCLTKRFPEGVSGLRFLEVASYAHTTGYALAKDMGLQVTLFDISANTLRLGSQIAREDGFDPDTVRKVAGDFHCLPFEAETFDIVYVCSAVHHTRRWEQVIQEMIRVLVPGGVLILDNEPCKRELCFYKFRTNRMDNLSPFETTLMQLGLLRTIAEPHLGSRPETIFGMTENEEIGLEQLIGLIVEVGDLESIEFYPEMCMDNFEYIVSSMIERGEPSLSRYLEKQLLTRLAKVTIKPRLTDNASAVYSLLPTTSEIATLSQKIGSLAANIVRGKADISWNPFLFPGIDEKNAMRSGLAALLKNDVLLSRKGLYTRIFGGGVRLEVRKAGPHVRGTLAEKPSSNVTYSGVELAFPKNIVEMMDPARSVLPIIQVDPKETVEELFGADWRLEQQEHFRCLVPLVASPGISINSHGNKSLLVFFRCYVVNDIGPWRLCLKSEEKELCYFDVYRSESIVLAATLRPGGPLLHLQFESRPLEPSSQTVSSENVRAIGRVFNISHCGAVIVE